MTEGRIREIIQEEIEKVQHKMVDRISMETKEAAVYLGISEEQLRIMARANEIPHFKLRSWYYFRKDTLNAWIAQQEGFTPPAQVIPIAPKEPKEKKLLEQIKQLLEA